jgi:hypothetical protein
MQIDPLNCMRGVGGKRRARWRMMTGADELALFGSDFAGAVDWLSGMLVGGDEWIDGRDVPLLNLADADRLFEAVYRRLFGPNVELRHRCTDCREAYELSLRLDDLRSIRNPDEPSEDEAKLPGGTVVRALRLADLLTSDTDEKALIERAVSTRGSDDDEDVTVAIERLSPSHIENIETICPHCRQAQILSFDLSDFLLRCCARERPVLLREIHLLARSYGWGLGDITALDRSARHELVRIIMMTREAQPKWRAA